MKRHWAALIVVVVLGLAVSPAHMLATAQDRTEPDCPDCGPGAPAAEYVPGELLVRFRPAVSKARAAQVMSAEGAEHARGIPALGVQVLRLPPGLSVEQAMARFNRRPEVDYAEPNYILHIAQSLDPGLDNQWGPQQIGAPEAWDSTTRGDPSVIIAIVDTGIDYEHPELAPNRWQNLGEIPDNTQDDDENGCVDDVWGCDFVNGDGDPMDDHSHGTHVAGIAAADENGIEAGLVGICPNCTLMPVKVMSAQGTGNEADVAAGITYAADNGAKVINLSLRFATTAGEPITLRNAVDYAWAHGAVVAAATGNEGLASNNPYQFYPAAHTNAIGVAATDQEDLRSCYSNYGGDLVSVAAPGDGIYSTLPLWADNDYGLASGTSMATPHVSGLAGLLFSHFPGQNNVFVRDRIEGYADYFGTGESDASLGSGRINAYAALTGASPLTGRPPGLLSEWNTASGYAHTRKLVRDTAGTLHLAWHTKAGSNYQVLYVTSVDDGASWSAPKEVFSSTAETWHPALALDDDFVYFAFASKHGASTYRTFFRRLDRSTDAWDDAVALTESGYDAVRPDLYLDPASGWLHMVASSFDNAPYVYYRVSEDQGATWIPPLAEAPRTVDINDPGSDPPECVADTRYATVHAHENQVWLVGRVLGEICVQIWPFPWPCTPTPIYCTQTARSTDGGATWPVANKQKLSSWTATMSAEYGLSLAGVGDRLYLAYEVGSGGGGGLYFRRWQGTWGETYQHLETTGLWPTITQAADGQAWMMWEDAGSLKMRHYDGVNWDPAETVLVGTTERKGYYPNLALGTAGGRLDWVYTSCKGLPYSLAVDGQSVGVDAPPTVHIDDPTEGQTVAGTYTVWVDASDDSAVDMVELSIDGGAYQDITGSYNGTHYTYGWDTTDDYLDGDHTLQARATDDMGQLSTSAVRNVTVDNVNEPPVASFTVDCTGLTCDFDASDSYDPDGTVAAYEWDFGDGNTGTGVAPSHTYAVGGTHTVWLTVTDNGNATDQTSQAATPNEPPVAAFTHDCTDLMCTFNASSSEDPDGIIASYAWTFGDGGTGSGVGPSHTYSAGDTYPVTLTVTDDGGATDQTSQDVHVNAPPTASFTYDCTGLNCTFDAGGSSDPDGSISSYDWTFGDGQTGTGPNPNNTYPAAGTYAVILTVTDNEGATDIDYKELTVQGGGGTQTVHVGDLDGTKTSVRNTWTATVTIEVHDGSHAPAGGATVTGVWSDGAGGEGFCTTGTGGTCTIQKAGIPKKISSVVFTVTGITSTAYSYEPLDNHDPDGDSNGTRITVPPPANQPPVALFDSVCSDQTCEFDASGSYDLDGSIIGYAWDFGDGNGGSGMTPSHTYAADGTYAVELTVTDDLGATGTASESVTVGSSGSATMHVGGLGANSILVKRDTRWNATVTITVHDGAGACDPLSGATMAGTWSDGATGGVECTTDDSGQCQVTKANLKLSVPSVTFTVTGLTHATHSYAWEENHNPTSEQPSVTVTVPPPPP